FQAEDGIRDKLVTGVQTCALPIYIFRDEKTAAKSLADLAKAPGGFHVAPRTRQVLRNLRPLLFRWLEKAADPDMALNQFIRFVRSEERRVGKSARSGCAVWQATAE